jgi:hypothetical protein
MKAITVRLITQGLIALGPLVSLASAVALFMWPLLWLPAAMLLFVATWLFYGHLMNLGYVRYLLEQDHGPDADLPHGPRELAAVLLLLGYLLDWLLNAAVFALLLLRIPLELTVSEALNRYAWKPTWKGRVARYFGRVWINPLDHKSKAEGKEHIDTGEEKPT